MKKIIMTAILSALTAGISAYGQVSPNATYLFAEKDGQELFMDVYDPAAGSASEAKPSVIFMFGGGFIDGERDNKTYLPWFKQLTENGYRVISIDYRLGLKGTNKVGIAQVNVLDKAIHMAVEDLYSATNYILDNAGSLGVNPEKIVISGSSAGAITVLQAEWERANRTSYAQVLPADFKYAGVMSFAGAILSRSGKLKFKTEPAPMLMLHGTADNIVNYGQTKFFNLGFFGTDKIVERLNKFGYIYKVYRYLDNSHEIATHMGKSFDFQLDFLENNVIGKKKETMDAVIYDPSIKKWVGTLDDMYGNQ